MEQVIIDPKNFIKSISQYSIHTMEIKKRLEYDEYWKLSKYLLKHPSPCEKKEVGNTTYAISKALHDYGITISLQRYKKFYDGKDHYTSCLHLRINPSLLLSYAYATYSPIDVFAPTTTNIKKFLATLDNLLAKLLQPAIGYPISAAHFQWHRVDICVNCFLVSREMAKLAMKLMKRSILIRGKLNQFVIEQLYNSTQHRMVPFKNAIRLKGSYFSLDFYDKEEQLSDQEEHFGIHDNIAEGLIRFEFQANAEKIQQLKAKYGIKESDLTAFMRLASTIGKDELLRHVRTLFGQGEYAGYHALQSKLKAYRGTGEITAQWMKGRTYSEY